MVTTMIFPTAKDVDCRPYNFFVTMVAVCAVAMIVGLTVIGLGTGAIQHTSSTMLGNILLIIGAVCLFGGMGLYFLFIALANRWAKKMERLGKVYIYIA